MLHPIDTDSHKTEMRQLHVLDNLSDRLCLCHRRHRVGPYRCGIEHSLRDHRKRHTCRNRDFDRSDPYPNQGLILKHLVLRTIGQAKRLIVIVFGFTVLIAGVAMIMLPGPAVIVIPIGLAILATEYIWARKLLELVKERIRRMNIMKRK